jgi:bifunctional non-homologous end joining protein LigD
LPLKKDGPLFLVAVDRPDSSRWRRWGSRDTYLGLAQDHLEQPDRLTFDLDPDPALPWKRVKEAAQALRERLSDLGLHSFVKTTGGKGLHVVVPIAPRQDWDVVKVFARKVAESFAEGAPELPSDNVQSEAQGKIFIDYLTMPEQRPRSLLIPHAPVPARRISSLELGRTGDRCSEDHFTIRNVPQRLARLRRDPGRVREAPRSA